MARRKAGLNGVVRRVSLVALAAGGLSACATTQRPSSAVGVGGGERAYNRPYEVNGRWYRPEAQPGYDAVGLASWYSYEAHNRTTADGEVFDARLPTAAHKTLPIPSYLEVTNLANGRRVRVRLNDRGPFVAGRIIDLSRAAAAQLGFLGQGTARVRVRYLGPAPLRPGETVATARLSAGPPEGDE
jgi:rare lipoprotein A